MSPRRIPPNVSSSADELRRLRRHHGFSQARLAHELGYSLRQVKRWENGECEPRSAVLKLLRESSPQYGSQVAQPTFTFVDLFAGIGGLRMGYEAAGGRCLFTSEWDQGCQATYRANFGDDEIAGDIRMVSADSIPSHDVLLAGFPCQPFSLAGVSKLNALGRPHGFECETQGTLFFEVERILAHHRPKAFLLENVKNIRSHDSGRTFATIIATLEKKLGYHVTTRVIDARCVVPQHRERIFIAGFREDVGFDWDQVDLPSRDVGPRLSSILHAEDGTETPEGRFLDARGRVLRKYVLSDGLWNYLQAYAEKHRLKGNGFGFGLVGPGDVSRTLSARYYKDGSEILVKRGRGNPRRLTPRECARLMGFDRSDRRFKIPVSDTQAYKQFGNSVVVPVIEAIARAMRSALRGEASPNTQLMLPLAG